MRWEASSNCGKGGAVTAHVLGNVLLLLAQRLLAASQLSLGSRFVRLELEGLES